MEPAENSLQSGVKQKMNDGVAVIIVDSKNKVQGLVSYTKTV